jgi:hypothetical protein
VTRAAWITFGVRQGMKSKSASSAVVWSTRLVALAFLFFIWGVASMIGSSIRGQVPNQTLAIVVGSIGLVVSLGTFFLRRWGIALLALACGYYAVQMAVGSVKSVPFPFLLINLMIVALFLVPSVLAIVNWRSLRW